MCRLDNYMELTQNEARQRSAPFLGSALILLSLGRLVLEAVRQIRRLHTFVLSFPAMTSASLVLVLSLQT